MKGRGEFLKHCSSPEAQGSGKIQNCHKPVFPRRRNNFHKWLLKCPSPNRMGDFPRVFCNGIPAPFHMMALWLSFIVDKIQLIIFPLPVPVNCEGSMRWCLATYWWVCSTCQFSSSHYFYLPSGFPIWSKAATSLWSNAQADGFPLVQGLSLFVVAACCMRDAIFLSCNRYLRFSGCVTSILG